MSKSFCMALLLSLAAHGAFLVYYDGPSAERSGEQGIASEISVLGVVQMSDVNPAEQPAQEKPETSPVEFDQVIERPSEMQLPVEQPEDEVKPEEPEVPVNSEEGAVGQEDEMQGSVMDLRSRYLKKVAEKIEAAKKYPRLAYSRGQEGTALIKFTIAPDGKVSAISLEESSGSKSLNRSARQIVQSAAPFEPIPDELGENALTVVVPVAFEIDR